MESRIQGRACNETCSGPSTAHGPSESQKPPCTPRYHAYSRTHSPDSGVRLCPSASLYLRWRVPQRTGAIVVNKGLVPPTQLPGYEGWEQPSQASLKAVAAHTHAMASGSHEPCHLRVFVSPFTGSQCIKPSLNSSFLQHLVFSNAHLPVFLMK